MTEILTFTRSDGIEFEAVAGSAAAKIMARDGAFTLVTEPAPELESVTTDKTDADFPEGFPAAARKVFDKEGVSFADIKAMSLEQLTAIRGIGTATAESILALFTEET